ncbi:exopolyphosphatase [Aneurinibacillus migulanus]|uniref:Exopolyphosphatase n=1 Tax=Aneurinibacillus migulanus TaxID=47500 RepID=A0A0D1X6X3_ANEMI|nr:bifunctional oligoribonuclease/PAP phosphatase NrnA [Aneurinibacillus migulanus]KIV50306.1 exopolyphosphatase [Aneurinibacillus migulanus]KIV55572.1 exopolyphosphatase [Aneurinibacillus migulanus]KON95808.1 exopolyphosphatase [Aneurinibacillus migulanus]KPD06359.1 exopolyphosphatase [Aneurinibacillus migulanus]MCP1355544.1 bifunctional oligoribonuclease/PAP phosphatase NrnA [Aneurinibacillus migulanus]
MSSYKASLEAAASFLNEHDHFLVVNHVNPDGDATGSLLAMKWILHRLGKQATLVNEGETPVKFMFLPGADEIIDASVQAERHTYDAIITCDCADFARIGEVKMWFAPNCALLNIDHHPTNDLFGTVNLVRTDAAATAEIIFDLINHIQLVPGKELATCLYTGLLTDTGGFRYSNTTSHVMAAASELLGYGVEPGSIAERVLESITKAHISLLQRSLQTLQLTDDDKAAYLTVTLSDLTATGASSEDTEGIVNYGRNIDGVEVGVLFKEVAEDQIKVSFRSRSEVDVASIAKSLGGGGHIRAAGCTVAAPLMEAKRIVIQKVSEALRECGDKS